MNRFFQPLMGILIFVSLTGCDQVRGKLGDLFQDKTPQQVNQQAQQALAAGQPQKAIEKTLADWADALAAVIRESF